MATDNVVNDYLWRLAMATGDGDQRQWRWRLMMMVRRSGDVLKKKKLKLSKLKKEMHSSINNLVGKMKHVSRIQQSQNDNPTDQYVQQQGE
ncbi:hypothetical protein K2173_004930 [Erythroxylum novogranatense]|uniref:Ribosomal protein L29 n=1 Tax=Erythroxylum novogranatense TaxID=1862640 RepID=A0AAV8UB44_9ROSI|nr:hypothetical protein K2173_004930 [Erythroxylum novogranatense]